MTAKYDSAPSLSDAGRVRLQQELDLLRDEREPQSWQCVRDLRDGAPAEDIEIMLALEEHQRIRQRIEEIERLLALESTESARATDAITLGSSVTASDVNARCTTSSSLAPLRRGRHAASHQRLRRSVSRSSVVASANRFRSRLRPVAEN